MADLESLVVPGIFTFVIIGSVYLGNRTLCLYEKRREIVKGSYARLCKSPRSNFWHKFYMLGESSKVVTDYLKELEKQ